MTHRRPAAPRRRGGRGRRRRRRRSHSRGAWSPARPLVGRPRASARPAWSRSALTPRVLASARQLPLEHLDARDQPPELAGELDRANTACSRLRVALLLVEGARRRLLGETPGALPAIVVPAHDPTLAVRIELDAHDTTLVGQPMSAPPPIGLCHENLPPPSRHQRPTRQKSPANAGLFEVRRRGLEPPPGYPGPGPQPCNPGVRSVQIVAGVQNDQRSGRNGRNGRSGCCRGCCHAPGCGSGSARVSLRHRLDRIDCG